MTTSRHARSGQQPAAPPSRRRISPGLVILVVALISSIAYVLYAVTVRDAAQIPLLASGAVVVGIVFVALALYSLSALWEASRTGRGGRAILLGLIGGGAAMVAAGCLAGAVILFMLSSGRG